MTERAWIELSRSTLADNVQALQGLLPPGCALMPVLKANAYGHGAVELARLLEDLQVRAFCVATIGEAIALRENGIAGEILILGYTAPPLAPLLRRYDLLQTAVDAEHARALNAHGPVRVHLKIDTGMHRLGEPAKHIAQILAALRLPQLSVEGIYTHLCADDTDRARDRAFTLRQYEAFCAVLRAIRKQGVAVPKAHILASYGLLHYPAFGGAYARTGIALYGVLSRRDDRKRCPIRLMPVLSLYARVATVKNVRPGESVGYGLRFTAKTSCRVATLTIGYADGIPRALSDGKGRVLLHDRFAPILGVCMDQTLVDVTGIDGAQPGDTATILGSTATQEITAYDLGRAATQEITAYDLAEASETITNEILARFSTRLARRIVD